MPRSDIKGQFSCSDVGCAGGREDTGIDRVHWLCLMLHALQMTICYSFAIETKKHP